MRHFAVLFTLLLMVLSSSMAKKKNSQRVLRASQGEDIEECVVETPVMTPEMTETLQEVFRQKRYVRFNALGGHVHKVADVLNNLAELVDTQTPLLEELHTMMTEGHEGTWRGLMLKYRRSINDMCDLDEINMARISDMMKNIVTLSLTMLAIPPVYQSATNALVAMAVSGIMGPKLDKLNEN